jgi:hypothetical protein
LNIVNQANLTQAQKMHNLKHQWMFNSKVKNYLSNKLPSPAQFRKLSKSNIYTAFGEVSKDKMHNVMMQKSIDNIKKKTKDKM